MTNFSTLYSIISSVCVIAYTEASILVSTLLTICSIYSTDWAVCVANFLISAVTTAKLFPDSPALAASIEAFKEIKSKSAIVKIELS